MYNLSTVIKFEAIRTLKKKSFWVIVFGFPIMMGLIFAIIFFSSQSANQASAELEKESFSIEVTDDSHLVKPALLEAVKAKITPSRDQGIADVKSGKTDAYIYYPADLATKSVEVYGQNVGIFQNGRYSGVAMSLLAQSVQSEISPQIRSVIAGTTKTNVITYQDGEVQDPIKEMILPGVFLVLFYLLIAFFGGQMLTSTTEEKENRVIEMILTTIDARTLIIGKIISLVGLALFQGLLIIIPALIGYLLFHDQLNIPAIDLSALPVDWGRILAGGAIFLISFLLFTGLLVLIGSSVPTAKEASQFFGFVMIVIFGPLYAAPLFVTAPDSPLVQFLSYFPLTAPIPLLLRNAVGNLTAVEAIVSFIILAIATIIIMLLAVRVFRFGALEYSRKVSLREMFSR